MLPRLLVIPLTLLALTACDLTRAGECLGSAIGQSIGNAFGSALGEGFANALGVTPLTGPDVAARTDAGTFLSVSHEGGRLELAFAGAVRDGTLPRSDSQCLVTDSAVFRDADGGRWGVSALLTEASESAVDGGTRLRVSCTNLRRRVSDGGSEPLPDRRIDLVAP